MAHIDILVGTVTGNALTVAQTLAKQLSAQQHQVAFIAPPALPNPKHFWLICTSNTGVGELPDNLHFFYDHLRHRSGYLGEVGFALVNLGDSAYRSFAEGGKSLEEALLELGATPISPTLVIDAIYTNQPAEAALTWLASWEHKL